MGSAEPAKGFPGIRGQTGKQTAPFLLHPFLDVAINNIGFVRPDCFSCIALTSLYDDSRGMTHSGFCGWHRLKCHLRDCCRLSPCLRSALAVEGVLHAIPWKAIKQLDETNRGRRNLQAKMGYYERLEPERNRNTFAAGTV